MREPDKGRFLRAVRHVEQEEVPFFEVEVDFGHVERVLGRPVQPGLRSYQLPGKDYAEFLQRTGMDMAYAGVIWKLGRVEDRDRTGRVRYIDGGIKTLDDIKAIEDPGVDQIRRRLEELLGAFSGTKIGIIYNLYDTPPLVVRAIGYETYYTKLKSDPDFIREIFKRVDEIVARQAETVLEYPIDAVFVGHNLAIGHGPVMSLALMEEFEFPYLRRHINLARARNLPVVYHCDGNNMKLFSKFIEMGVNVFQAIDPCNGLQSVYEVKRRWGDQVALHGNIDVILLMSGTPQQIADDVAHHVEELSPGGGYICGSSHDIHQNIPFENFQAMIDAIHAARGVVSRKQAN